MALNSAQHFMITHANKALKDRSKRMSCRGSCKREGIAKELLPFKRLSMCIVIAAVSVLVALFGAGPAPAVASTGAILCRTLMWTNRPLPETQNALTQGHARLHEQWTRFRMPKPLDMRAAEMDAKDNPNSSQDPCP